MYTNLILYIKRIVLIPFDFFYLQISIRKGQYLQQFEIYYNNVPRWNFAWSQNWEKIHSRKYTTSKHKHVIFIVINSKSRKIVLTVISIQLQAILFIIWSFGSSVNVKLMYVVYFSNKYICIIYLFTKNFKFWKISYIILRLKKILCCIKIVSFKNYCIYIYKLHKIEIIVPVHRFSYIN